MKLMKAIFYLKEFALSVISLHQFSSIMPYSKRLSYASFFAGLCISITLSSHANDGLLMKLQANKVVSLSNGDIKYIPVNTAKSGTVIQYKATYVNMKQRPIYNLMVTLPIPHGMTFTGEVYPPSAQASIDGNNFIDMPLMRREGIRLVEIPYSEYNSLRWHIKYLPVKKAATVSLNALVD